MQIGYKTIWGVDNWLLPREYTVLTGFLADITAALFVIDSGSCSYLPLFLVDKSLFWWTIIKSVSNFKSLSGHVHLN